MTATAMIAELAHAGIHLSRNGDRLHVEAKPGTVTAAIRERLTTHKPDLLALLEASEAMRQRLLTLANAESDVARIHRIPTDDLAECHDCTDDELRGYLRALDYSARMDAGQAPPGYTKACECSRCGPVLLWPGAPVHVTACPWCFRHRAGKAIPRPSIANNKEQS